MGNDSNKDCEAKNCSHFINKNKLHLYKGKFLTAIISCTVCIIILFLLFLLSYSKSQDKIVGLHKECNDIAIKDLKSLTLTKDSTIHLDKIVIDIVEENQQKSLSLLELQYNKLQNDFTILSLWAGILMIVFLIFSIYSMFKVDEMQKQGRSYLDKMEEISTKSKEISAKIEKQATEKIKALENSTTAEMNKLSGEYDKRIKELENKISEILKDFESSVNTKTSEFQKISEKYRDEMKKTSEQNNQVLENFVQMIVSSNSSSKELKD